MVKKLEREDMKPWICVCCGKWMLPQEKAAQSNPNICADCWSLNGVEEKSETEAPANHVAYLVGAEEHHISSTPVRRS